MSRTQAVCQNGDMALTA